MKIIVGTVIHSTGVNQLEILKEKCIGYNRTTGIIEIIGDESDLERIINKHEIRKEDVFIITSN